MKKYALIAPIAAVIAILAACSHPKYQSIEGAAWGTTFHITYLGSPALADTVQAVIDRVNSTLSPFNPQSQISRINRGEDSIPGPEFAEVFALSQHVCSISGGLFDPTVAPLVNLWGFGYKPGADAPTQAQIDSALAGVGILQCHITPQGILRKKSPRTEFNFSAIAKGYGVDLIARALRASGCNHYMVEVGGEIALAGKSPRGTEWRIQVDAPDFDQPLRHNRQSVLSLTDCAIATSGNYRNYRHSADTIVGHTISPVTGRPVISNVLSATVIAPSCALADALATAAMAMHPDSARAMIASQGLELLEELE